MIWVKGWGVVDFGLLTFMLLRDEVQTVLSTPSAQKMRTQNIKNGLQGEI